MAKEKHATLRWQGSGLEFTATLGMGHSFTMHNPPDAQGGSPMDYLLAGVAGCTAMDVVSILQKMRQQVAGLEVQIHGIQAETPPSVYTSATITYVVRGEQIDPVAVARAIELSQTKYCSASVMFQQAGVEIVTNYLIEEVTPV